MNYEDAAAEQLDQYLDRLATDPGRSYAPNGLSSSETLAAETFRALDAGDTTADPRSGFLAHLKEQLDMTEPSVAYPRRMSAPVNDPLIKRPKPSLPGLSRRFLGTRYANWFATAALLAVVVIFGLVSFYAIDSSNSPRSTVPGFAATPQAVAELGYQPVDIAECTTNARPTGTVMGLVSQTPERQPILPNYLSTQTGLTGDVVEASAFLDDSLPEVERSTLEGVNSTLREATACRFYFNPQPTGSFPDREYIGLDGRFGALYSDDFYRREAYVWAGPVGNDALTKSFWIPIGPKAWTVDDTRTLPDGRVAAVVSTDEPIRGYTSMAMVFVQSGDRWLIDEIAPVARGTFDRANTQFLEFALVDDEYEPQSVTGGYETQGEIYPNTPLTITVANVGHRTQDFRIDAVGFKRAIEPGHSVSFSFTAPPGQYVMTSYIAPSGSSDRSFRRLGWVLYVVGEGTPIPLG